MPEEKTNKRQQQAAETRQRLLTVSLELFIRNSYAGTTVRDIAKSANVSPGLLFHYFRSKQAMLEEHTKMVEYGINLVAQALSSSNEPLETFRMIAKMSLESFKEPQAKHVFLLANQVMSLEQMPLEAKQMVNPAKSIELSVPLIILGQQKHEIKAGNPKALSVAFWGAIQGIAEILIWNPEAPIPNYEDVVSILKA